MVSKFVLLVALFSIGACASAQPRPTTAQTQPAAAPRLAALGERCGTYSNIGCESTAFCDYSSEQVAAFDGSGTCSPRPTQCDKPAQDAQVCGRDTSFYPSECHAHMAGVDVVVAEVDWWCKPRR